MRVSAVGADAGRDLLSQLARRHEDQGARREMTKGHPNIQRCFSYEPEGLKTVRVFSDGVPERDYPEGGQLEVVCAVKLTARQPQTKNVRSRQDAKDA